MLEQSLLFGLTYICFQGFHPTRVASLLSRITRISNAEGFKDASTHSKTCSLSLIRYKDDDKDDDGHHRRRRCCCCNMIAVMVKNKLKTLS